MERKDKETGTKYSKLVAANRGPYLATEIPWEFPFSVTYMISKEER